MLFEWGLKPHELIVVFFFFFQDLEFHGVMRFYFQDRVAGNFATKCIRVSSTATTQDVIETLAEKFRPDMRMLSSPKYSLYEVHVSGGESWEHQKKKKHPLKMPFCDFLQLILSEATSYNTFFMKHTLPFGIF